MTERKTLKGILRDYWVVLITPVVLFLPLLVRGQVLFWGTTSLQFVPWWVAAWNHIQQGELPLWNALNGMGAPLLANYQLAFFYPPNWVLLLLAGLGGPENGAALVAWGYSFLAILHLAWAGLGMALLLRRLRFPWLAQVIGGIAYGLSGYIVGRMNFFSMVWAAAWLPWIIYFTDQIASPDDQKNGSQLPRFKLLPGLTLCFTFQLLAGHAQLAWYTILLAAGWVTVGAWRSSQPVRWHRRLLTAWCSFGAALLLAVGLAMIQLAPTFEYLRASHRADAVGYEEALTYSYWPWRLMTLFSPDFFGNPIRSDFWGYASYWEDHLYEGLLPFLLALVTPYLLIRGIFRKQRPARLRLQIFLWIMILVAFMLAFGRYTPVFPFLYAHVPTFSMFQAPTRYLIWTAFAIPILAAVGVEHWRSPTGRGLYWFHLGTAGAFAITLGAGLATLMMQNIRMTFIRATALTGVWALGFGLLTLAIPYAEKHGWKALWQWAVIGWTLMDILVAGWSLNVGVSPDFYTGQSQAVSALSDLQPGERVYLSQQEEDDVKFKRFIRFKDFTPLEDWRNMRNVLLPDVNLLDGISLTSNFDPLVPGSYVHWMNDIETLAPEAKPAWLAWMGVGAVEHIDASQPTGVRFDRISGAQRWHWYNCATFVSDTEQSWAQIDQELLSNPRPDRPVLLERSQTGASGNCSSTGQGVAAITTERAGRVVVEVDAPEGGWFELMDTQYPGWVARVDGQKTTLYLADGNFRAVRVEKGRHQVEFLYLPSGFYFGALLSILVLLFVIILLIRRGRIPGRR